MTRDDYLRWVVLKPNDERQICYYCEEYGQASCPPNRCDCACHDREDDDDRLG